MKSRWLPVLMITAVLVWLPSCSNSNSSTTGHLFVATQADSLITPYNIDLNNGELSANGSALATGSGASVMVLAPSGNTLFLAEKTSNDIRAYTVNSNGTLTAAGGPQATTLSSPAAMAINSAGTFLFVANPGNTGSPGSISVFSVSGTTLSQVAGSPFLTTDNGVGPIALGLASSGNFLYVANQTDGTVSAYTVSSAGALSLLASPYTVSTTPSGLAMSPDGNFLYVSNFGSNNISSFAVCTVVSSLCPVADGSLAAVTGGPFAAGIGPTVIAPHATLKFVYVLDTGSNQISGYTRGDNGSLSPLSPATVATGVDPVSLVIQPQGNYLYVANDNGATILGFHIDQTSGLLGPLAPFTTGGNPAALAAK